MAICPRQGHYALDPKAIATYPLADLTVERIGQRVNNDLAALFGGSKAVHFGVRRHPTEVYSIAH